MKKRKIALLAAGFCVVLGIVLSICGLLAGGDTTITAANGTVRLHPWGMEFGSGGNPQTGADSDPSVGQEEVHQDLEAFTSLRIDGVSADVSVAEGDGYHLRLVTRSPKLELSYSLRDGTLSVRERGPAFGVDLSLGSQTNRIEVTVPAGVSLAELDVSLVSGDFSCGALRADAMSFESTSGDVSAGSLSASRLTASTVSGELEVRGLDSPAVKLSSTSGDVTVSGLQCRDFQGESVSGGWELSGTPAGPVSVSTTSGDIQMDFRGGGPYSYAFSSVSGDLEADGDGDGHSLSSGGREERHITCETVSGDVELITR